MQYRPYGDTGRMMSFLGMDVSRSTPSMDVLETAEQSGINLFSLEISDNDDQGRTENLIKLINQSDSSLNLVIRYDDWNVSAIEKKSTAIAARLSNGAVDFLQLPPIRKEEDFNRLIQTDFFKHLHRLKDSCVVHNIIMTVEPRSPRMIDDIISVLETDNGLISGISIKSRSSSILFNEKLLAYTQKRELGILIENADHFLYKEKKRKPYRDFFIYKLLRTNHSTSVILPFSKPEYVSRLVLSFREIGRLGKADEAAHCRILDEIKEVLS